MSLIGKSCKSKLKLSPSISQTNVVYSQMGFTCVLVCGLSYLLCFVSERERCTGEVSHLLICEVSVNFESMFLFESHTPPFF